MVTTASNTVSVAFANNPTGATLGGTLSVTASQGVATFSGLTITRREPATRSRSPAPASASAISSAITVTKKGGAAVASGTTGTNTTNSLLGPLILDSPDSWNGLGLKKRGRSI